MKIIRRLFEKDINKNEPNSPMIKKRKYLVESISAVDLFCGVGALSHGLIQAGLKVNAGVDIDESCKYAYEKNNHAIFLKRDIKDVSIDDIKSLYP